MESEQNGIRPKRNKTEIESTNMESDIIKKKD